MTSPTFPARTPAPDPSPWLRYTVLLLAGLALFLTSLSLGAVAIPLGDVLDAVFSGSTSHPVWRDIVLEFRLPRATNAAFSGAALGVAGLMLQTLFRNPLADPFVLGIVHGARLGAALLVTVAGLAGNAFLLRHGLVGDVGLALAAVAGACAVLAALTVLSRHVGVVTLLVAGLMLGYLAVGLISVSMHFIDDTQAAAFKAWDDASFAGATRQQLRILLPGIVFGLGASAALVKPLNGLLLGERYAASLGMHVGWVKGATLCLVAWLCGLVTAFCGPVAFLGLVAAQLARALMRSMDHRLLLPAAALIGTVLALAADLIVHLPWSRHVFHLNAVIGLVGAPVALYLLYRNRALHGGQ